MGRTRSRALCRRQVILVCEQIYLSDLNWTRLSVLDCEQLPAGPGTGARHRWQRPEDDEDKAATGLLVVHLAASLADGDRCRDDDVSRLLARSTPGPPRPGDVGEEDRGHLVTVAGPDPRPRSVSRHRVRHHDGGCRRGTGAHASAFTCQAQSVATDTESTWP
jgi:hypothetical protein